MPTTGLISLIIPARNEEQNVSKTIKRIQQEFDSHQFAYEILVVNDGSTDSTEEVVVELNRNDRRVKVVNNANPSGIGNAIKTGLEYYQGDAVIIAMADGSDDPKDMVSYIEQINKGYDCCFGNRWQSSARVENYPKVKLFLNRLANWCISFLFGIKYKDITNAFKCYTRKTLDGLKPILSHHFNITVELPLKAIVRGYRYAIIPTNWQGRKIGNSSLKIKEMGSRYFFIICYVWLEKMFSKGDYKKK